MEEKNLLIEAPEENSRCNIICFYVIGFSGMTITCKKSNIAVQRVDALRYVCRLDLT